MSLQPAAYWLTQEQSDRVRKYALEGQAKKLGDLIRTEAREVPHVGEPLNAALFGELMNFLVGEGSVPLPPTLKPLIEPSRDDDLEMYWRAGICILLNEDEARDASRAVKRFIETATDEVLSDREMNYLILFSEEPEAAREGVEHLQKAFDLPPEYHSVLLVMR